MNKVFKCAVGGATFFQFKSIDGGRHGGVQAGGFRYSGGGIHKGRSENWDSLDGAAWGFVVVRDGDASSWQERFWDWVCVIAYEAAGEVSIIFDGRG